MDRNTETKLRARAAELERWIRDEAPYASADQRHLDEHTPERAYWHLGYLAALRDVISLMDAAPSQTPYNEGKSS